MPATNELLQEGRYRVSQPISPDGTVFEAYDTVRNTTVLVREFPVRLNKVTTVSQQESIRLAFASQAKALTEIDHDSLLNVQDYFSDINRQYLVMESVEGENLFDLVSKNKKAFRLAEVVKWADQLLDALDYLHSRRPSVVHRGIRPQNLRLDSSGRLKLAGVSIDSGAEGDLAQSDPSDLRYSPMEQIWPGLDPASQKVITNSYDDRSERILKEPLDARSDIYSLGASLYFLVTGQEPVDPLERSIDILEGKLDPLREPTKVDPRIPAEISDVLMKALEIKRENRYDSALIMRQVLKSAVERVEEREFVDDLEQQEAAEFIRAAQTKSALASDTPAPDPERLEEAKAREEQEARAEADRLLVERLLAERKAAERAQAERLEAERAEAERLAADRAEKERLDAERIEAERTKAEEARRIQEEAAHAKDDNLLDIPVSAEVMAYRDTSIEPDEADLSAVLDELERAEKATANSVKAEADQIEVPQNVESRTKGKKSSARAEAKVKQQPVQIFEQPIDAAPETTSNYGEGEPDLFSDTQSKGSSLPMPAIAGGIGLLVLIAVGIWFAMSGSAEPASQPQPTAVQAVQPAQPEPTPQPDAIDSSTDSIAQDTNTSTSPAVVPGDSQQTAGVAKPATTPKPKKAEVKPEPEKKKVTVDDLINDN